MKKIITGILLSFACLSGYAQSAYDMIATAYVTTTLSQIVVLNSAEQSAGNFTFSIQAHNGGGRPNQPIRPVSNCNFIVVVMRYYIQLLALPIHCLFQMV